MTLPIITELTALDIARWDLDRTPFDLLVSERIAAGRPADGQLTVEEIAWLTGVYAVVRRVQDALESLRPPELFEVIKNRPQKTKRRGPHFDVLYFVAWQMIRLGYQPAEVFHTYVLPELIQRGDVTVIETGEAQPEQEGLARQRFYNALSRWRKRR